MNARKLVDFRGSYHYCYQHGQSDPLTAKQILVCLFPRRQRQGRRRSTRQTDRKKALKVAGQFEQVGQRKLAPRTAPETLAELYREIYTEKLPVATVRKFIADWLHTNNRKYLPERLRYTKRALRSFSSF
jgi:hypothetical protein